MKVGISLALQMAVWFLIAAPSLADTHWLNFNPYAYTTEFFYENGQERGACGAAAVVLVESHLELRSSIPSDSVRAKNDQMRSCSSLSGKYYITSLTCIMDRLEDDGYRVINRTTGSSYMAAENIFSALERKRWVIILARQGFTQSGTLGHFYPVYGGNEGSSPATSTIRVIEDYNRNYSPSNPNWSTMYQEWNLSTVLTSMRSASTMGLYNILEVYKP